MYPNVSSILIRGALRGTQPCTQTSRAWRPRQRTRASLPHTARSCWAALCRLKSSSHQGKSSQAPVKSSQVKGSSVQAPRAAPLRRQRAQRLPSRCEYSQPERRQRAQRLPSKRQGEVAVNVQSRCNPDAIQMQSRCNPDAIQRQSISNQEAIERQSRGNREAIKRHRVYLAARLISSPRRTSDYISDAAARSRLAARWSPHRAACRADTTGRAARAVRPHL